MGFKLDKLGLVAPMVLILIILLVVLLCVRFFQKPAKDVESKAETALVPTKFCSTSLKIKPLKPLIYDDAAPLVPKPWLNVESNILYAALIISETSDVGLKIKSLSALVGVNSYASEINDSLKKPHITLLRILLPDLTKNPLQGYFSSDLGFKKATEVISECVKKHIINKGIVLEAKNNEYMQFDTSVVKKFAYKQKGHSYFKYKIYKPFREDVINSLNKLISQDKISSIKCFPELLDPQNPNELFTHYTTDKSSKTSSFAVEKRFIHNFNPHISIIESKDKAYREDFINQIQGKDSLDINRIDLSSKDISHIFVSYLGKWNYIPV